MVFNESVLRSMPFTIYNKMQCQFCTKNKQEKASKEKRASVGEVEKRNQQLTAMGCLQRFQLSMSCTGVKIVFQLEDRVVQTLLTLLTNGKVENCSVEQCKVVNERFGTS